MATALLGLIEEFDGSKEANCQQYVECLAHFFAVNGITDGRKKTSGIFVSDRGCHLHDATENFLTCKTRR